MFVPMLKLKQRSSESLLEMQLLVFSRTLLDPIQPMLVSHWKTVDGRMRNNYKINSLTVKVMLSMPTDQDKWIFRQIYSSPH
mmetsp:Transcript_50991/g.142686  ORF Transcript_50991/g.142686 Transcript_50991/m.142686 type:complete len:82 (-) Transcript_50991:238-483(-)